MKNKVVSRRTILEGACALAAAAGIPQIASADAKTGLSPKSEETIRKWYAAWEKKDWRPVDILLADDFTFTSAAGDDHISKSASKRNAGSHRLISSSGLTCSGYLETATRRL
jgi:hypothetical protein